MELKSARKRIHDMRSSLNVVSGYVELSTPPEDGEDEFK